MWHTEAGAGRSCRERERPPIRRTAVDPVRRLPATATSDEGDGSERSSLLLPESGMGALRARQFRADPSPPTVGPRIYRDLAECAHWQVMLIF